MDQQDRFSEKQYAELLQKARKRLDNRLDDESRLRQQSKNDRRFLIGDSENGFQWDMQILRDRRANDKPCLTINKTKNHFNLIVNAARQNPPAARILPVDGGSDVKSAEWMGGIIRNVEANSQAEKAYITGYKNAVAGGEGYWWINYEYESPTSFSYQINVKEILDPDNVVIDEEPDPCKRAWGFVFEDINKDVFRDKYGIDPQSWVEYGNTAWSTEKTVRVANYFWREDKDDVALLMPDGSSVWKSESPESEAMAVKSRPSKREVWHSWLLGGEHDKPLEASIWPGRWLPIVRVIGEEWVVEGIKHRKGHIRDLKDPARMYNYWSSEATTQVALQNHAPYVGPAEAFQNFEKIWNNANRRTTTYLPYNSFTEDGQPIPAPAKQQPAQMSTALVQGMQIAASEFSMASGQYEAQFGAKSNETSGRAIDARKMQSEVSTYHYADELGLAIVYSTKVMIDLIQKLFDVPKVVRILGLDKKEDFVQIDPSMSQSSKQEEDVTGEIKKLFNPSIGQYDVVISVGPSYQTQRQAANESLQMLSQSMPMVGQAAADLVIANQDFPGAEKIAKRIQKAIGMQMPQLIEDEGEGAEKKLAQMQAQITAMQQEGQQLMQAMQQRDQVLQQAAQELQQKDEEIQSLKADAQNKTLDAHLKVRELELKESEMAAKQKIEEIKANAALTSAKEGTKAALIQARVKSPDDFDEEGNEIEQVEEPTGPDPMEIATLQAIERAIAQIAQPKRSVIRIEKQPDGSYTGEKIEIPEDESMAHEQAESASYEAMEGPNE